MSHSSISGTVKVQYLGKDLNTVKSERCIKTAVVSVVKDEEKGVLFLRISPPYKTEKFNISFGFPIIEPKFFDKCVKSGMSTIKLAKSFVQVMLSNCPPEPLQLFLTTIRIKLKSSVTPKRVSTRESLSVSLLETVSPVTKRDTDKIRQKAFATNFMNMENISPIKPVGGVIHQLSTPPRQTKRPGSPDMEAVCKRPKLKQTTSTPNAGRKLSSLLKSETMTKPELKRIKTLDKSLNESFELTEFYKLSDEQVKILEDVKNGRNVFYTGSAGTGKTYLIKKIIGLLAPCDTAITASTGVAANLIDGCTLHSFAGIGASPVDLSLSIAQVRKKQVLYHQWRKVKHLIIDEISLITAQYFDHLDELARVIRNNPYKPFGGIQMIMCGDFLQLPPVIRSGMNDNYKFAFQSKVWREHFSDIYSELTVVKRQSDTKFIDMLNQIRVGKCQKWVEEMLNATRRQNIEKNGIVPTKLCTHKVDVDDMNSDHLRKLEGQEKVFIAIDSMAGKEQYFKSMSRVETRLLLKVGAQVMLLKNLDLRLGLVNGARGVVTKFTTSTISTSVKLPVVKFMNGCEMLVKPDTFSISITMQGIPQTVTRRQLPLQLAYAMSVHKSQGLTLDCVELYLDKTFEAGQAYVALSRCSSLETMRLMSWHRRNIFADNTVIEFYNKQKRKSEIEFETDL